LDLNAYNKDVLVINSSFISSYNDKLKTIANSLQAIIQREESKNELRQKIEASVNAFSAETIGNYRKQLKTVENVYEIKLTPFVKILDEEERQIEQLKIEGTMPQYLPLGPDEQEIKVKMADLEYEELHLYAKSVNQQIQEATIYLKNKSGIPELFAAHERYAEASGAIEELRKSLAKHKQIPQISHSDRVYREGLKLNNDQRAELARLLAEAAKAEQTEHPATPQNILSSLSEWMSPGKLIGWQTALHKTLVDSLNRGTRKLQQLKNQNGDKLAVLSQSSQAKRSTQPLHRKNPC
jgi:nitrate reductase NapAB chaperone NapD